MNDWLKSGCLAASLLLPLAAAAQYAEHPETKGILETLRSEYGFDSAALARAQSALGDARTLPQLIVREQTAPERTETWTRYASRIDAARIDNGRKLLRDHAETLARVEAEFGVAPSVVAAILGIETRYGRITGNVRVLDALATQGYDHPTRSPFFRSELIEFLAFCEETGRDPRTPTGSYAGAMGAAQFMPSNYRRLAVDFDQDGDRDLWQLDDAIGSIGRYLVDYRPAQAWRRGEPLMVPATVSGTLADTAKVNQRTAEYRAGDLSRLGIRTKDTLPAETPAGIIALTLEDGSTEYWVGLPNFYAVMTYNPRTYYAMAVAQLARAIGDDPALPSR
ncbi:lytic murein transglycosylase [Flagellatimonas centrodinii]|uniref:lytic murein transglycosylase n=1 Tax=Flagellatimonas centrodinii TaxID=2806210 RepID=UPI001FEDE2BE|nr:lytic murein transglycosylase [Flagellatimonas centrodinii]ULQ45490.1 lytic murein transglycosylase [Flagellatimonas centrodinii]